MTNMKKETADWHHTLCIIHSFKVLLEVLSPRDTLKLTTCVLPLKRFLVRALDDQAGIPSDELIPF